MDKLDGIVTETRTACELGMIIADLSASKGDGNYVVIPAGMAVTDLEKYMPRPRRLRQNLTFDDSASFVSYVNRFKTPTSTIFSCQKESTFTAVLDYHDAPAEPAWAAHIATLKLQTTEEWDAWRASNRRQMDQGEFAEFLEVHFRDIHDPPAATMLTMALAFEAKKDATFKSCQRLENGQVSFAYSEVVTARTAGGNLEVPSEFRLFLSVYKGHLQNYIDAKLRYRLREAKLTLWYDLVRPEKLVEASLLEVSSAIAKDTGITPLAGSAAGLGGAK